jgi:hypothetical protein
MGNDSGLDVDVLAMLTSMTPSGTSSDPRADDVNTKASIRYDTIRSSDDSRDFGAIIVIIIVIK